MGPRALLFVILLVVAFMIYALMDCARRSKEEIRSLPKPAWIVVIILLPAIGTLLWFLMGRARPGAVRVSGRGTPPRRGPAAPDDDPEFLRQIEISRRQRERRQKQGDDRGRKDRRGERPGSAPGDTPGKPEFDSHDTPSGGSEDDDKK